MLVKTAKGLSHEIFDKCANKIWLFVETLKGVLYAIFNKRVSQSSGNVSVKLN